MIPGLHVVTDDRILASSEVVPMALAILEAGQGDLAIHVRGPRSSGARLFEVASALRGPAANVGAQLLVNDRVDVALCLGLPGVNLGLRSIPAAVARRLIGRDRLLGVSVHGVVEARDAALASADFLLLGTVFASASHPGAEVAGPELVTRVVEATGLPVLAIGGITPDRVASVGAAGAHGVAVLSGVWDAAEPGRAVGDYLAALRM